LAYTLFVSHSFQDAGLVEMLKSSLRQPEVQLYIAETDPRYGESLPAKIESRIEASDALLVILTRQAGDSPSVNQEVGYAKRAGKLIIALVEKGARVGILLQGIEYLEFSTEKMSDALDSLTNYIAKVSERRSKDEWLWLALGVVIIGIFGIVAFALSRKK
jgi:TIR domain